MSVQSFPTVFSPSSLQILLVAAMYSMRGTLEELTANLGPFCSKDCSPSMRGLLDRLMTHFFLMMSGTAVFLYLGVLCRYLNYLICWLLVVFNTFSLDLMIVLFISMNSLLLHVFLMLALILLICALRFLMILLQCLTQLFKIDLCVSQMICFSLND